MQRQTTFFAWQNNVLGWLLGWGITSIVVGAGLATDRRPHIRHVGIQAIGWGLIDAALGLSGRRAARMKQTQAYVATAQPDIDREAARFQWIVAINASLDLLYIVSGLRLIQTARPGSRRHGIGLGIAIQGLFLLIYDSLLTWWSARWRSGQ